MNPAALISTAAGMLSLVLSVVLFLKNDSVQKDSAELQKKQTENQTQSADLQVKQQTFQMQQQAIQRGAQLAEQIGPAVLNDLGVVARDNNNEKIKKLLEKYGVTINDKAAPAPAPAAPNNP